MKVTKRIELDYGHTLPNHMGFCNQLHGHRGVVEATVDGDLNLIHGDPGQGMVMDFGDLKKIMMEEIHAKLDHGFAVWKDDNRDVKFLQDGVLVAVSTLNFVKARNTKVLVTDSPPTAEFFARWAYHQIVAKLEKEPGNLLLLNVRFYETPGSWADYGWDDWMNESEPLTL